MFSMKKMSRHQQIEFLTTWASMKQVGSTDKAIVRGLKDDYEDVYGKCPESEFCKYCIESELNGGIASLMEGWFDDDLALLVKSSKKSANVEASLNLLLNQTKLWRSLKSDIVTSLLKNGGFVLFSTLIFIVVCCLGVPHFLEGIDESSIPAAMLFLRDVGVFIENKGGFLISVCSIVLISCAVAAPYYVGDFRALMDKRLPFYQFYAANHASKLFTMVQVMIASGDMSLRKALENVQESGLVNRYISSHIDEMLYRLKERKVANSDGVGDLDVLDTGLLPPILRLRLKTISNSGNSHSKADMMEVISESLVKDYASSTRRKVAFWGVVCQYGSAVFVAGAIGVMISFVMNNLQTQVASGM